MKIAMALGPAAAVAGCVLYVSVLHGMNVGPSGKLVLEAECASYDGRSRFLIVELWMRDIVNTNVDAVQAFIEFDVNDLTYRGDLSSYTDVPFPLPNRSPMHIAEAAADPQGVPHPGLLEVSGFAALNPTNLDSLLATFVFEVNGPECDPAGLTGRRARTTTLNLVDVARQRSMLYTRLASDGNAITTIPVGVRDVGLDGTPPQITAPDDVTVMAPASLLGTVTVDLGTPTASDNCTPPVIGCSRDDGEPCSAPFPVGTTIVTWTAVDDCGNESSQTQGVTVVNAGAVCDNPKAGDCCFFNGSPGCEDFECCSLVCEMRPECCTNVWNFDCAALALQFCDACGITGGGDCCSDNGTPDCDDSQCSDLICQTMPQCCSSSWDANCAAAALEMCGVCSETGTGDCCTNNPTPGCEDSQCTTTVCDMRPECCSSPWDFNCAALALQVCDACSVTGDGDCCTNNGTPGCEDSLCTAAVCEELPLCCSDTWDFNCAALALQVCDACIAPCGLPTAGDCCSPNEPRGCDDFFCCKLICDDVDPTCCEGRWDPLCAAAALAMCDICIPVCPDPIVDCSAEFVRGPDDDDDDDGGHSAAGSVGWLGLGTGRSRNNAAGPLRSPNVGGTVVRTAGAAAPPAARALPDGSGLMQFLFLLEADHTVPPTDSTGNRAAPARSTATGVAFMTLNLQTWELTWDVTYQLLSSSLIATRFHGPAFDGQNADTQIYLSDPNIEMPGAGTIFGSTFLNAGQAFDLAAGQWYLDLSTLAYPAGELRGQALPSLPIAPNAGSCTVRVSWTIDSDCGIISEVVRLNGSIVAVNSGDEIDIDCSAGNNMLEVTVTNSGGTDSCTLELCQFCESGPDDDDDDS